LKYREYNQFGRKVPKNAEVANIQVQKFAIGSCKYPGKTGSKGLRSL